MKRREDLTARREQQKRGITKNQGQEDGCTALPGSLRCREENLCSHHFKKIHLKVFQVAEHHVNFPMSNLQVHPGAEVQTQPSSEPVGLVLPSLSGIKANTLYFFFL